jgi:predicted nucleic acid-binding protein
MSAEFVDTNVLLYAHSSGPALKRQKAVELLEDIVGRRTGAVSTQVLSEFYAAGLAKLRLTSEYAEKTIRSLSVWAIHRPDHADLLSAIGLQRMHQLSWWDAMIVNSAMKTDSQILWTEDLNHGQRFGSVVVQNPFR